MPAKRTTRKAATKALEIHAATPDRWKDLEKLFGPSGACAGCWCTFFKKPGPDYAEGRGAKNKSDMRKWVTRGHEPGLLAYVDGEVAGWCAVEPKERYVRIMRSRSFKDSAGDETPTTWAVPCFFVAREHRRRGLTVRLLGAALEHARAKGATRVEGYPVAPRGDMPDAFAYHGTVAAFEKAGFDEEAAPSKSRRLMSRSVGGKRRR